MIKARFFSTDSVAEECEGSAYNKRGLNRILAKANPVGGRKDTFLD